MPDQPGATGDYPDGKLNDDDEGGLGMRIGVVQGRVVIDFGKPVTWIGFRPNEAYDIAKLIRKHAKRAIKSRRTGQ